MTHYEIYFFKGQYEIWKCHNNGIHYHTIRLRVFKTKKGAENWARKQWNQVIWR